MASRIIFVEEQIQEIILKYQNGESYTKIAKCFKCNEGVILRLLKRYNIKARKFTECRKYKLDESYFEKINTPNKAYFLGLMYADGNVRFRSRRKNNVECGQFRISLQIEDSHIIENFKKELEYSGNLTSKKQKGCKDQVGLEICSTKMARDLEKLGCIPTKSLVLEFPKEEQVPSKLLHHFIRGYFDGDGCITSQITKTGHKQMNFSIVGTKTICENINIIFHKNIDTSITKLGDFKTYFVYNVSGNNNIRKIYDYLYKDAIVFLIRKHKKFKEVFNIPHKKKTSKYKNIYFDNTTKRWVLFYKGKYIKSFNTEGEAKLAKDIFFNLS
jgi:intein-encoded DNA endonuclease-like protein